MSEKTLFSANLGFLWTELSLPDAIRAAARAGFDAVECHWPYTTDPGAVSAALAETGLPMLGLNTSRGDVEAGDNGLSACLDRKEAAQIAIDAALAYADAINAGAVHVMAGKARGPDADTCFRDNLAYALDRADGRTLLIEPLNAADAPGYFLETTRQARDIIDALGAPNLRLMFDCYHVARTEGDVLAAFQAHLPVIGHVQFAGVPRRGRPDEGDLEYGEVISAIKAAGWTKPLGAEYKPGGSTEDTLGWMAAWR